MRWLAALALLLPAVALGAPQRSFHVDKGATTWTFDYRWRDADGEVHEVAFALPSAAIEADRAEGTGLPRKQLYEHAAAAVRTWGRTVPDVRITAVVDGGSVNIGASGPPGPARAAMKEAARVRDAAIAEWLAERGYTRTREGEIAFDHATLVAAYSEALEPVAEALSLEASDPREFAELALSFVQTIPYEARKKNGRDAGYRRPLALLARNRGDCDSKTVLYLGLVRAAHPELDLAVVYVPGHALGGVALPEGRDDRSFRHDGVSYLFVEPVGPALHRVGEPAPEDRRAGKKGEVRPVPAAR